MSISYSPDSAETISSSLNARRRETVIRPPSFMRIDLGGNLARLVEYRDLLYTLSVHRIKVRYKQTALGISWAIVRPVALMLIYTLTFSLISRVQTDGL